ncbi:hypothetical protein H0H87_001780 [Tephrocybe sp. NHM501043]|nr:hypothetical protein H0H87_001780 [Tephrocybe sp. NHM501043]
MPVTIPTHLGQYDQADSLASNGLISTSGVIGSHIHEFDETYSAQNDENQAPSSSLYFPLAAQLTTTIPWNHGSNDIFKAVYQGFDLSVKVMRWTRRLRFAQEEQRRLVPDFLHEVQTWKGLSNPHLNPILGMAEMPGSPFPALVSPWMEHGNIGDYMRTKPDVDRLQMINSIAVGLTYLHEKDVIHGDLHPGNILVDSEGIAKIADFGLSSLSSGDLEADDRVNPSHITWQAPEIVLGELLYPTKASDIYSFASVVLRIISGNQPFNELGTDVDVVLAVYAGTLPFAPANKKFFDPPNANRLFWDLMLSCWSHVPNERPQMGRVHDNLVDLQVRRNFFVNFTYTTDSTL